MKIAVFDVCGTLYNSNTTFDFLDWYFKNNLKYKLFRKLSKSKLGKLANYPFYKFLKKDLIRIYATKFLNGIKEKEIEVASNQFVNLILKDKIKKDIEKLMIEYKNQGYEIVLISGSYNFIIKEVSKYFKINDYFASNLEIKSEKYTGKIEFDQLFNKINILKSKYPNFKELVVVSDNLADYPLLKEANKSYIICNKHKHLEIWEKKNLRNAEVIKHYD